MRDRSLAVIFSARTEADVIDRDASSGGRRSTGGSGSCERCPAGKAHRPAGGSRDAAGALQGPLGHDVFIAGAPGFVLACAAVADALAARRECVHTEVFFVEPQPRPAQDPQAGARR